MNHITFITAMTLGIECLVGFMLAAMVFGFTKIILNLFRQLYSWPALLATIILTLAIFIMLVSFAYLSPAQHAPASVDNLTLTIPKR